VRIAHKRLLRVASVLCGCLLVVAALAAQQAPDRSQPPRLEPAPALHLPVIQKRQLSNGLSVWIV
jgi:hypothetical protein